MRASRASELRRFLHFHSLNLLVFLSIFSWYFRYFIGTNDMLVGLLVFSKSIMPPPPPLATLVVYVPSEHRTLLPSWRSNSSYLMSRRTERMSPTGHGRTFPEWWILSLKYSSPNPPKVESTSYLMTSRPFARPPPPPAGDAGGVQYPQHPQKVCKVCWKAAIFKWRPPIRKSFPGAWWRQPSFYYLPYKHKTYLSANDWYSLSRETLFK